MFKGRIISRSNINGKIHTFQKDFDDYDAYQEFLGVHPEYSPRSFLDNFLSPWSLMDHTRSSYDLHALPSDTRYLPDGIDLDKYEKRRAEKRQTEVQKMHKKQSLEKTEAYFKDYLEENPDDTDAQDDLKKIQEELKSMV